MMASFKKMNGICIKVPNLILRQSIVITIAFIIAFKTLTILFIYRVI